MSIEPTQFKPERPKKRYPIVSLSTQDWDAIVAVTRWALTHPNLLPHLPYLRERAEVALGKLTDELGIKK